MANLKIALVGLSFAVIACGSGDSSGRGMPSGGGGAPRTGACGALGGWGGFATGAGPGSGGSPIGSGGTTGGSPPVAGGAPGTGGTPSETGGAPSETGGAPGTGGAPPAPTCAPTASLAPGETTRSIQVAGTARSYILHVPPSYAGVAPVPLVIDFHPLLGDGATQRNGSGYRALSDQEGFIVAWPNGIDRAWNVGPCCTTSRTVDDVAFARAMVTEIESLGCVDPKRVYAAGYLMGGGMSHYLACHAADVFR
jgi:polyhydroxybutyrate depolymerase